MSKKKQTTIEINGVDATKLFEKASQNNQLRLTHAVLVDETCTYSYAVRLENRENDIMTNECGRQYHNDLKQAFRLFDGHLAVITEQVDADEVKDIDTCEGRDKYATGKLGQLQVSEVKINGNIETGSIVLVGVKALRSTEEIKLKTPKQAFDTDDYEFVNELVAATQNLINEITLYHNGKSRPELQGSLFETKEEITEEVFK